MKVFVTGVRGQLGHDVVKELEKRGIEAVGVDIQEMDITDEESVSRVILGEAPDAVIHCAAYTAVDAAEENVDLCRRVNADGPRYIAKVCRDLDIKMIYISTDYVFSGQGERPWEPEDEKAPKVSTVRPSMKGNWRYRNCWKNTSLCGLRGCLA